MGFVWFVTVLEINKADMAWLIFTLSLYAGLTMVSNVPFYSFKDFRMRKSVPFAVIVSIALIIAVINIHPPIVLFSLFMAYGFSGYAVYGWRRAKGLPTSVIIDREGKVRCTRAMGNSLDIALTLLMKRDKGKLPETK